MTVDFKFTVEFQFDHDRRSTHSIYVRAQHPLVRSMVMNTYGDHNNIKEGIVHQCVVTPQVDYARLPLLVPLATVGPPIKHELPSYVAIITVRVKKRLRIVS